MSDKRFTKNESELYAKLKALDSKLSEIIEGLELPSPDDDAEYFLKRKMAVAALNEVAPNKLKAIQISIDLNIKLLNKADGGEVSDIAKLFAEAMKKNA